MKQPTTTDFINDIIDETNITLDVLNDVLDCLQTLAFIQKKKKAEEFITQLLNETKKLKS